MRNERRALARVGETETEKLNRRQEQAFMSRYDKTLKSASFQFYTFYIFLLRFIDGATTTTSIDVKERKRDWVEMWMGGT
jgi:hypothetical protein